jgi:hypothetical protein
MLAGMMALRRRLRRIAPGRTALTASDETK